MLLRCAGRIWWRLAHSVPSAACLAVPMVSGLRLRGVSIRRVALHRSPLISLCEFRALRVEIRPHAEGAFLKLRHMLLLLRKRCPLHGKRPLVGEEMLLARPGEASCHARGRTI